MKLMPNETEIVGSWLSDGKRVRSDANELRINWLLQYSLERVAADWSGWEILFRDRGDGRLWEITHPHGELQGGGPRRLAVISLNEASQKYGLQSIS
jgi:hypothetical protein